MNFVHRCAPVCMAFALSYIPKPFQIFFSKILLSY